MGSDNAERLMLCGSGPCADCDGEGVDLDSNECPSCTGGTSWWSQPATPADLVAHVVALPADERQAIVEAIVERDPLLHVWRSPMPAAVVTVTACETEEDATALAREREADDLLTTPEWITKCVVALPADEAQALLVALLRARPDVAVAAVTLCPTCGGCGAPGGCSSCGMVPW